MNSIPLDLSYERFSRLPTKSIGRFRCVSELWRSILCSAYFTELYLTKSSARPSLLFAMEGATNNEFLFYSSPQIHSQNDKSSSLSANCKLKLPKDMQLSFCSCLIGKQKTVVEKSSRLSRTRSLGGYSTKSTLELHRGVGTGSRLAELLIYLNGPGR
ncbi:hypothetical protein N665_0158s0015 [Sinapis alba]|nr:hypothetical protein N665_0158s0015 [Sinapis alba]